MKKVHFIEEQMVAIRREADKTPVAAVAKKHRISEQTIYIHGPLPLGVASEIQFTGQTAHIHTASWMNPIAQMGNPHEHSSTTGRPPGPL